MKMLMLLVCSLTMCATAQADVNKNTDLIINIVNQLGQEMDGEKALQKLESLEKEDGKVSYKILHRGTERIIEVEYEKLANYFAEFYKAQKQLQTQKNCDKSKITNQEHFYDWSRCMRSEFYSLTEDIIHADPRPEGIPLLGETDYRCGFDTKNMLAAIIGCHIETITTETEKEWNQKKKDLHKIAVAKKDQDDKVRKAKDAEASKLAQQAIESRQAKGLDLIDNYCTYLTVRANAASQIEMEKRISKETGIVNAKALHSHGATKVYMEDKIKEAKDQYRQRLGKELAEEVCK